MLLFQRAQSIQHISSSSQKHPYEVKNIVRLLTGYLEVPGVARVCFVPPALPSPACQKRPKRECHFYFKYDSYGPCTPCLFLS